VTIEGNLTVRVAWDGRQVRDVSVRSMRPFAIARVLFDRTPAEAAAMVPRLFSVCGGAHAAAAAGALDAALVHRLEPGRVTARELTPVLEAVQEHSWRLLIDWPKAMGHTAGTAPVAAAGHAIAPVLARLVAALPPGGDTVDAPRTLDGLAPALDQLADDVYGMTGAEWLALQEPAALDAWMDRGATLPAVLLRELYAQSPSLGASDVGLMPAATRDALLATVVPALRLDPGFVRAPVWGGVPVETGALARQRAHPLVAALHARDGNAVTTRMAARLTELAALLERLRNAGTYVAEPPAVRGHALGEREGLAAVETAGGLLLHRVRLDAGNVARYDIVAPTEWNFHPSGALARGLAGLGAGDEATLVRAVRIAVQALEPCVPCHVEIAHV
jgi:hypothetical protein